MHSVGSRDIFSMQPLYESLTERGEEGGRRRLEGDRKPTARQMVRLSRNCIDEGDEYDHSELL